MSECLFRDELLELWHGDSLDVLPELEDAGRFAAGVDAFVQDPPYASGTRHEAGRSTSGAMLRGGYFADRPLDLDQMTTQGFVWLMRAVGVFARRVLVDGGSVLSFIDWRQWPNLAAALETANLRVQGMVVWDKGTLGLGQGFRYSHELVCHASKGVPVVHDRTVANVLRHPRAKPVHHPSPKPVDLMADLLRVVAPPGGLVVDAFAGSASTLIAARRLGVHAIGIESDRGHAEHAAERLGGAVVAEPGSLFAELGG